MQALSKAHAAADGQVFPAQSGDHRVGGGHAEERPRPQQAEGQKNQRVDGVKEQPVVDHRDCGGFIALAQALGEGGVEAHAQAYAAGDHQKLHRVGVGQGQKFLIPHLGHADAVHHVVQR